MSVVTDESSATTRVVLKLDEYGHAALTPMQVAAALSCSLPSVYKALYSNELRSFKIGGMRRVAVEDLVAYLEKKRAAPPSRKVMPWSKPAPAPIEARRGPGRPRKNEAVAQSQRTKRG
jgi:excisionase family DNA binding protein